MHSVYLEKWQFDMIIEALMSLNESAPSPQIVKTINSVKNQMPAARKEKAESVDPFSSVGNDPINW